MDSSNNTDMEQTIELQVPRAATEGEGEGEGGGAGAGQSTHNSVSDSSSESLSIIIEEEDADTASTRELQYNKFLADAIRAQDGLQNASLVLLEFWRDTTEWRRNMLNVRHFRFESMDLEQPPPTPSIEIRQMLRLSHCQTQPNGRISYEQLCFALSHGGSMARVMVDELQGNRILSYNHQSRTYSLSPRLQYSRQNMAAGIINENFLYVADGQRAHESSNWRIVSISGKILGRIA